MIKVKPIFSPPFSYAALQTIAYHSKDINSFFCPIFNELKLLTLTFLKEKYIIFSDMSPSDLENRLNSLFTTKTFDILEKRELDIGKFDKSQGLAALLFECSFMELMGVPAHIVTLWYNAHENTIINDRKNGVKSRLQFQRK